MDKTQLISKLGETEGEIVLLESKLRDYERQQNSSKAGSKNVLLLGVILTVTGIGAIIGIPLIIMGVMGQKEEQKLQAELSQNIKATDQELTEKRALAVSLRTQIAALNS